MTQTQFVAEEVPAEISDQEVPAEASDQEQLAVAAADLVEDDLLIEDISIDGMCGVY